MLTAPTSKALRMLLTDPATVGRTLLVAVLAYVALLLLVRLSGKRTLAQLNAFDLIVTVAIGSTLATTAASAQVSWVEGLTVFGVLVCAQAAIAWASAHVPAVQGLVKARPTLLLRHGEPLEGALRSQRMTVTELRQAARSEGHGSLADLAAVVLETDGTVSVIAELDPERAPSALVDVEGFATRSG